MIAILSSAKTLDFETPWTAPATAQPAFIDEAKPLIARLRKMSPAELSRLMGVSAKIASLNARRFADFSFPHTPKNARPAIRAYQGDVYRGLHAADFTDDDLTFAQRTLRTVSGLYGVVRPLDLIQPYRLEMAIALSGPTWTDLYDYWADRVTEAVDRDAKADGQVILNLASQEYSGVLRRERLKSRLLTLTFKESRGGKLRVFGILAKRARGAMARYIVKARVASPEGLTRFAEDGYRYAAAESTDDEWVFARKA